MKKRGFSLIELLIVVAILSIVSRIIFGTMNSARIGLGAANNQINSQQEARRVMNRIMDELKIANHPWQTLSGNCYVTINSAGDRIDFCIPVFSATGIEAFRSVRYYVGGVNNNQLLRREGSSDTVLANDLHNIKSQKPFFSPNPLNDLVPENFNNTIGIKIPIIKNGVIFNLDSKVNLRNRTDVVFEVPVQGIIEQ